MSIPLVSLPPSPNRAYASKEGSPAPTPKPLKGELIPVVLLAALDPPLAAPFPFLGVPATEEEGKLRGGEDERGRPPCC
jgi:hypothetical protein